MNGKRSIDWLDYYYDLYEHTLRRKAFMHHYMGKYDYVEADFY
jgi:hypothetical protein